MLHSHHSYLLYAVRQYSFIVRLHPTPLRSVTGSVIIQTPLADVNKLILANDDNMPKYRHEKIACPCHKPSRLTLRWLASRTFNILVLCRYSRPATASLPTHSFLVLRSTFYIYGFFSCIDYMDILPISTVTGIFPAKLAAMIQSSNSACGLVTVDNLPFPRKRIFFTHNLPLCLFLRPEKAENIPPQADGLLSRRRKKASKRGKEKMYHLKIRK